MATFTGLLALAPLFAFAAAAQSTGAERAELLAIERSWNEAVVARDVPRLERILADDFQLVWVDGSVTGKRQMLTAVAARQASIDPFTTEDVRIELLGNGAILSGRFTQTAHLGQRSETHSFRYTDVYRRQGGRWRAILAQATLIR